MPKLNFSTYDTKGFYDEMFDENNKVRPNYKLFLARLEKVSPKKPTTSTENHNSLAMGLTFY